MHHPEGTAIITNFGDVIKGQLFVANGVWNCNLYRIDRNWCVKRTLLLLTADKGSFAEVQEKIKKLIKKETRRL